MVSASNAAFADHAGNANNNTASNANYVAAIKLCAMRTDRSEHKGRHNQVQRIKERQTFRLYDGEWAG